MKTNIKKRTSLIEISTDLVDTKLDINTQPAVIEFNDYDKLKNKIDGIANQLQGYVVTPDSYSSDKKLRSYLNKLKKGLNDKRLDITRQQSKQIDEFSKKMKVLTDEINVVSNDIGDQIKQFDNKAKRDRHERNVREITKELDKMSVSIEYITYNDKWDNKTTSNTAMMEDVISQANQFVDNKTIITKQADAYGFVADHYIEMLKNRPLSDILNEMERDRKTLQENIKTVEANKAKERAEQQKQEQVVGNNVINKNTGEKVDTINTYQFELKLTGKQLRDLANYLRTNNIRPIYLRKITEEN